MSVRDCVGILREIAECYVMLDDPRSHAYFRAVDVVREWKRLDEVESEHFGIGPKITKLITKYFQTHRTPAKLYALRRRTKLLKVFESILGVGPATAREWVHAGIESLDELREGVAQHEIILTQMQKIGLDYYDDLSKRIPRGEVAAIGAEIAKCVQKVHRGARCELVGSYRRGAQTSGDVDMIAVCPRRGIVIPSAVMISDGDERMSFVIVCGKYGATRARQVDIVFATPDNFWYQMLYFTGSFEFNISMRSWAKSRGGVLNQHGMVLDGKNIVAASEKDIFDALGLRYVEPRDRLGKVIPG